LERTGYWLLLYRSADGFCPAVPSRRCRFSTTSRGRSRLCRQPRAWAHRPRLSGAIWRYPEVMRI